MARRARSTAWPLLLGVLVTQPACNDEEAVEEATPAGGQADAAAPVDASPSPDGGADASIGPGNADPMDLDPANGDPALDIAGSEIFFDGGAPWVKVAFFGAWPPSQQLYAWQCSVLLGTENAPVATYTAQGSNGAQTDFVDGIDKAKTSFVAEPNGFRVRFGDTSLAFDRYGLECSVQKTAQGTRAQDTSGNFIVTAKIERPFG